MSRKTKRMQPLVALRALKTLVNDPEQTDQVFVIIKAMSGDSLEQSFRQFETTPVGQKVLEEERCLLDTLLDRETLRTYATGTFARAYLNFVESEGITADGLVEASESDEQIEEPRLRRFGNRMRDQHDLWHVLTGYGRDTFGEACLLAFTYAQTRNRGLGIIALVGMLKLSKELEGAGVRSAMRHAYKAGKNAAWLPQQDWEALLAKPIDEVRQELNIPAPAVYREVLDHYRMANAA